MLYRSLPDFVKLYFFTVLRDALKSDIILDDLMLIYNIDNKVHSIIKLTHL